MRFNSIQALADHRRQERIFAVARIAEAAMRARKRTAVPRQRDARGRFLPKVVSA